MLLPQLLALPGLFSQPGEQGVLKKFYYSAVSSSSAIGLMLYAATPPCGGKL